jgi:D-serine deaminase-like pyridoxal phosphate-dependent protein
MDPRYQVSNSAQIITPALLVFYEILVSNVDNMIGIAGRPDRLRPHCKTHKMPRVTELQLQSGIKKHKAATFAEADMLAGAGVKDIFLAYNLVGPNISRAIRFMERYPDAQLSVTGDHAGALTSLSEAMQVAGRSIDVLLDIDTGQNRTGVPCGELAIELYTLLDRLPGLRPGGLHVYDGQNHQTDLEDRRQAVRSGWQPVVELQTQLKKRGLVVPRIVAGGTGSFPIYAEFDDPTVELSPGTCTFHDAGYGEIFPDLNFTPAALLLTRVISRPTPRRVTLDLGYKAVASDPPADRRVVFPDLPDAKLVLQNEEHLVIETDEPADFVPGDELLGIPRHICPTSALHKQAFLIRDGEFVEAWDVVARDRRLNV